MNSMSTNTRKRKTTALFMRTVLAENLQLLLARDYGRLGSKTKQQIALHKATGLSFSSVQRYCDGKAGASIDHLETLAVAFDLSVYQLLLPNLDARNPQVVKGAAKGEQAFYAKARRQQMIPATADQSD